MPVLPQHEPEVRVCGVQGAGAPEPGKVEGGQQQRTAIEGQEAQAVPAAGGQEGEEGEAGGQGLCLWGGVRHPR